MERREEAVFRVSLGQIPKGLYHPDQGIGLGILEFFQAVPLQLLSPDVPARGNLFLEHRVIVSGPQRNLCVREWEKLAASCLLLLTMPLLPLGAFGNQR